MKDQQNRLAIVIPAYKKKYLRETLDSLKNQTNQEYSLYIGDDNSPEDLWGIIKDYTSELNIVYKKFESNWGGKDLVSHWNRCLDLVESGEWIWLFSDDDCLDVNCVEVFYQYINENPDKKLIHFNVKVIDQNSNEIPSYEALSKFNPSMSSAEFFKAKIQGKIHSYVVEYVFHKSLLKEYGKFVNFDLAWCSDDATWINYAQSTGITTITGASVRWRLSGINISSQSSPAIVRRKLEAKLRYFIWVKEVLQKYPVTKLTIIKWFFIELDDDKTLGISSKVVLSYNYSKKLFGFWYGVFFSLFIFVKNVRTEFSLYRKKLLMNVN